MITLQDMNNVDFKFKSYNFQTRHKGHLNRHEKTCRSTTKFRFKEIEYGGFHSSVRKSLEEIGVLAKDFAIPFVSYDIETIVCEEEYDGKFIKIQKPISIAYFDGKNGDVFTGEDLMKKFLDRMN